MAPSERREQVLDAALRVIVEQGYEGVSIEATARTAGVTRPVIYDHFPNLAALLQALIEREERCALSQVASVIPDPTTDGTADPVALLGAGVRRFLEAVVNRPSTWQLILLPLDSTPAIVRRYVETNQARILEWLQELVRVATEGDELSRTLDAELAARAIMSLSEEAGRLVLTDAERYSPARCEAFVVAVLDRLAGTGPRPPRPSRG